ncbi:winged helix-turn-helix domain-containing protein [Streptomyces sp. Li-HN-5-13]|nr:winged helix-turn-helix domain-containing protein [Streptomyces sp. Li-HN-5-13]
MWCRAPGPLHGPPRGGSVLVLLDLVSPAGATVDLAEGIDRTLGSTRLRDELALYPAGFRARMPYWIAGAAQGQATAVRHFAAALRAAHRITVAPYWDRIHACLTAERVAVTELMAAEGIGGMLASLHPLIHWRAPVLTVEYARWLSGRRLELRGRDLILAPSFFARRILVFTAPGGQEVILIYPMARDFLATADVFGAPARRGHTLEALLGRTRASVLRAADGVGTGDLARRLGISAAGASQHTTVLRQAGLITSRRLGQTVRHTLTPLGRALLDQQRPST